MNSKPSARRTLVVDRLAVSIYGTRDAMGEAAAKRGAGRARLAQRGAQDHHGVDGGGGVRSAEAHVAHSSRSFIRRFGMSEFS